MLFITAITTMIERVKTKGSGGFGDIEKGPPNDFDIPLDHGLGRSELTEASSEFYPSPVRNYTFSDQNPTVITEFHVFSVRNSDELMPELRLSG